MNPTKEQLLALQLLRTDKLQALDTPEGKAALSKTATLLERQGVLGIKTVSIFDADYPAEFKAIGSEAPKLIFLKGNFSLLNQRPAVAIIGARKASGAGRKAAWKLGASAAEKGKVVVSGLALGCDASAHEGCLAKHGKTIAIVATGLDLTHPQENVGLQQRILAADGLLLTEQPLGVKANPSRLVARNRLQAALSSEVIVAECPEHSGTMHTVRFAQQYGKVVKAWRFNREDDFNTGNFYILKSGIGTPANV